ncbi:MAG: hypothetical protein F9K29_18815 [Hyphomicrobiaceae bacterium]|nr:MAG: hypothetical protein F9K29_18815 [Hyphomicrobiaceae bacterium]
MSSYPQMTDPISPDDISALIRRAHRERGEAIRQAFLALFSRRTREIAFPGDHAGAHVEMCR